ncbi:MAG: hypothetical protein AAFU77_08040 [Myxococcota bacterium]
MTEISWPSGVQGGTYGSQDQLRALDDRYGGFMRSPDAAERRDRILARTPENFRFGNGALRSLPSSLAHLQALVEEYGRGTVAVLGAEDELGLQTAPPESTDTLIVSVPGAGPWLSTLQAAPARTVIARVRSPFDVWWRRAVETFSVSKYVRDSEHYLVPGPFVLDGAGDIWVMRDFKGSKLSEQGFPRHSYRDFDGLDPARCTVSALKGFTDRVRERWGAALASGSFAEHGESIIATQFFTDGAGYTAELKAADAHLLLTFPAYRVELETTVLGTVYEFFGDELTRSRPVRTRWSPSEMVF